MKTKTSPIIAGGKVFTEETIGAIEEMWEDNPEIKRVDIARKVCELLAWKDSTGRAQLCSCLAALAKLEKRGVVKLPLPSRPGGGGKPRLPSTGVPAAAGVPNRVEAVKGLRLIPVFGRDRELTETWNFLVVNEHPQGLWRLAGRQMRYLIGSEHGWLGAIGFSAAAWRLSAREEWIGWNRENLEKNLPRVVNLSRFLIRGAVSSANLASRVLGMCAQQLPQDWLNRYGEEPLLLETFVDGNQYDGTCYRAANWVKIGETQGRGRQDRFTERSRSVKDIYMLPLRRDFREGLGGVERSAAVVSRPLIENGDWASVEFGGLDLGDRRLGERAVKIARCRWEKPAASFPVVFGDVHQLKGAYRLYSSNRDEVTLASLLLTHQERTVERMAGEKLVLAPSDTTSLNYNGLADSTAGLGPIGTNQAGESQGLQLHSSLAVTEAGLALGVLGANCWACDADDDPEKKKDARGIPIEEKESYKWIESYQGVDQAAQRLPGSLVVNLCDREGDVYELFEEALSPERKAHLVVRAVQDRRLADSPDYLWPFMEKVAPCGQVTIRIPRRKEKPAREAQLEVRCSPVTLRPPRRWDGKKHRSLTVWAVWAKEIGKPSDETVEWMLLTTVKTATFEKATEKIRWYCRRWTIEEWHRILKSGCRVEKRQLETAEALQRALAFDLVIAGRILLLTKLGRECPDLPCTVAFDECEWKVLFQVRSKKKLETAPSLNEMIREVAKLGGFLGRKRDGEPGAQTLWRGLMRLQDMVEMYRLLTG